jgi:hypothetical protein
VVDRIKSFSSVEKEEETLNFLNHTFKKKLINFDGVIHSVFPQRKPF